MLRAFTTFLQKKFFFTLTLVVAVIALLYPQRVSAAYENYKNLFTRDSGIELFKGSGQNSWAVTTPSYTEGISGFRFNIKLQFAPFGGESSNLTQAQLSKKWDYVSDRGLFNMRNVFIVRICENVSGVLNEDSCLIKEIPFTQFGVFLERTPTQIAGIARTEGGAQNIINILTGNNPQTTTSPITGAYMYPGIFEKKYAPRENPENPWLSSILIPFDTTKSDANWYWFKKNSSGTYVREQAPQIPFTTRNLRADFWYCAGPAGLNAEGTESEDGTTAPIDGNLIQRFSGLCGGTSYFRIGNPIDITMPASLQEIGSQTDANTELSNTNTQVITAARNSNLPGCSFVGVNGTFIGCVAQFLYHIVFRPMAWFATMVGRLFDFFLGFSINDEAYRLDFIQNGWQIVRDFSNIFFIIIMIYTGFAVALGFGKYSIKGVVVALIINALIINFSLFITRLGVDMSNILARVFYNQMTVDTTETAIGGYKPVSVALISTFNPQKLMEADILTQDASSLSTNETGNSSDANFNANADALEKKINTQDSAEYASFFAIVSIASALILFFVAKMFFTVAFVFIGRTVGLYMSMIFSPIAFLTRGNIPLIGSIGKINFKEWLDNYQKDLYLPPIFMFFLYIIGYLLSTSLASLIAISGGTGFFEKVISVAIPMIIVYLLIGKAKGIAERFASETAKMVTQKIEGAGKFVGGLALGGAVGLGAGALAMGGRAVGAGASALQKSKFGAGITRNLSDTGFTGKMARLANKTLTGAQNNSFDLRDNKYFNKGLSTFNSQFGLKATGDNKLFGALGLGKENSKGGYAGMQKKREEEIKKKAERIQTNFDDSDEGKKQVEAHYGKIQAQEHDKREKQNEKIREQKQKERLALENRTSTRTYTADELEKAKAELVSRGIATTDDNIKDTARDLAIEELKKEITKAESISLEEFKKEQEGLYGKVKDNKSLTQALRLRYAQNVANNPEQNAWDAVRVGAMGLGGIMIGGPLGFGLAAGAIAQDIDKGIEQRKKAAEKFIKDSQKTFKADQKKAQELDAAVGAINKGLEEYAERLKNSSDPTEKQKYEDIYKKAIKQKNGVDYYDHEALDAYEHLSEAIKDQAAELQGKIAVIEREMKNPNLSNDDLKAKTKAKEKITQQKKDLENARTKIENAQKDKDKEKKDGAKNDGDKKDDKK